MAKVKKFKIEKFKYQIEDSKNQKTEFRRQESEDRIKIHFQILFTSFMRV
jgi:hypothetical protein